MNRLCRLRCLASKRVCYHRNVSALYFCTATRTQRKSSKVPFEQTSVGHVLDSIPAPWTDERITDEKFATCEKFNEWIKQRNLTEHDGKMLNRLGRHILSGGYPDVPRLFKRDDMPCLKHMTEDYFTSIDTECFEWLQTQKQLYRNRTIHPWIQWKLELLNVTLEWTREPMQDRDFRWVGYHDDVLNSSSNEDPAEFVAESDPLFPLHSKERPLLKFLNPFYELWYQTMPPMLKQLRLINSKKEPKQTVIDRDDVRAVKIVKKWDYDAQEYRYYVGARDIDQARIDEEILYNQKQKELMQETQEQEPEQSNEQQQTETVAESESAENEGENMEAANTETESEQQEANETSSDNPEEPETSESAENDAENTMPPNQKRKKEAVSLRSAYLSNDLYDKNSYSRSELVQWMKTEDSIPAEERPVEKMSYFRHKEVEKEMKDTMKEAQPTHHYTKRHRGEYYVEALKRGMIKPSHLTMTELQFILTHLGFGIGPKQNPNTKQENRYVPYTSFIHRREPKTKWNNWSGNKPSEIYKFQPPIYDDVNGIFDRLDVYHKTKHPGQPAWGVWDIPEPTFDVEYFQLRLEGYLNGWRQSKQGREFIDKQLKRRFDESDVEDVKLHDKLAKGLELLQAEKMAKLEEINDLKGFRYKFANDPAWSTQCREKTMQIQKLQAECERIDEIIQDVYLYNDIRQ